MLMGIRLLSRRMYLAVRADLPEHVDVPVLVDSEENGVQEADDEHDAEEEHRRVVDEVIEAGQLLLLGEFRVDLHPRVGAHSDDHPDHLGVRDEAIGPDRVLYFQRLSVQGVFCLNHENANQKFIKSGIFIDRL